MSSDSFFERVLQITLLIPPGRVTTYGAIARYLGSPQSARMVGWALTTTKNSPGWIPAHRVVNRTGLLTGRKHFPGRQTMRELLESEGVVIEGDAIVNFTEVLWDPSKEL